VRAKQILLDASFCNRAIYNAAGEPAARKLIPRAGNGRPENGTYGACFRMSACCKGESRKRAHAWRKSSIPICRQAGPGVAAAVWMTRHVIGSTFRQSHQSSTAVHPSGRLRSIALPSALRCRSCYVAAAAAFFFVFFSAPVACPSSFFDLRAFFSAASSIS